MPPFVYQPVQFPFANNIASLMARQGDVQAQGLEQAANARAQGVLGAGQAWGGAIQGVGQAVGQIPAQMQQQQYRNLQMRDIQGQIAERDAKAAQMQVAMRGQQAVDGLMATSFDNDPTTGVSTFNRPKFEQGLAQSGQGHLYPQYAEMLDRMDASAAKRNAEGRELLANAIYGIQQDNYSPQSVITAAAYLKANGVVNNDHIQPALSLLNDPAGLKSHIDSLGSSLPEYRKLVESEETRKAGLAETQAKTAEAQATAAHTAAETAGTLPQTPAEIETVRHNKELERIQGLQVNRETAANSETARHNRAMEAIQNPFTVLGGNGQAAGGQSPQAQLHGADFLATLQPNIAAQVKAYAEGRLQFPGGRAMTSPLIQGMLQLTNQYDPSFDQSNYNARSKARTDLTSPSGKGGQAINSLNTALQHLGKLSDLVETMNNSQYPVVNWLENPARTAMGKTEVTNFNVVAPQAMKEVERLWRGAGGSDRDIQNLENSLGQNKGIQQQREAISNFVDLVKGKLDSLQTQRDNALGPMASPQVPVLYPQNQGNLDKISQRAAGSGPGKTLTIADVQQMATRSGKSYDEAKKYAESQGYVIGRQ